MGPGCLISLVPGKNGTIGRRQVVPLAADIDKTALHRIPCCIPQIALRVCVRIVQPQAKGVREPDGGRDVVGKLPLEIVLHRMINVSRAQRQVWGVGGIRAGESPCYRCISSTRRRVSR